MRKIVAPIAMLLGLALLVLGIGQQTWWAPPTVVQATSAKVHDAAALTIIDPNIENISENGTELNIAADGEFRVALGRSHDVKAWVDDAAHQRIKGATLSDDGTPIIEVDKVEGETDIPDPTGSDLWVDVQEGTENMTYRFQHPEEGEWSLLLFVDGKEAAPTQFGTDYEVTPDTSASVAMVLVGIVFFLMGLAVLIGSKPQRTGRRRAEGAAAVIALGGLVATGLAVNPAPAQAQQQTAEAPAVIVDQQAQRIIEDVAEKVAQADEAKELSTPVNRRLSGAARELRESNYKARERASELNELPAIGTNIRAIAATSDPEFPRIIVAVTDNDDGDVPQMLTLRQASARQNYRLISATPMVPGSELDYVGLDSAGLVNVDPNAEDLSYEPEQFFQDLAKNLSNEDEVEELTAMFEENPYIQLIREDQENQVEENPDANVRFGRSLVKDTIHGVTLPDGSALVTGTLRQTTRISPEDGATLDLSDLTAKLLGEDTIETPLTVQKFEQYTVLIPENGSEADVQILGVSEVTRNASTRDDD